MTAVPLPLSHLLTVREYADAGIPHYWIVDLDPPTSLLECRLTKRFGYREAQSASGAFATAESFPVHLDLEQLR